MRYEDLERLANQADIRIAGKKGEMSILVKQRDEALERHLEHASRDIMLKEELNIILKANAVQIRFAADNLTKGINHTLPLVFGSEYEGVDIVSDSTGSATTAQFVIKKMYNGTIYEADPYEDNGGGICDPISILAKLAALMSFSPPIENALLADEPTKHVSAEYRDGLAKVFRELSHAGKRQIIISTHDPALAVAADHVIVF